MEGREGGMEAVGVVGMGIEDAGGGIVFAVDLGQLMETDQEKGEADFALIRISNASIFFACSAFCLWRLVIRSSCKPLALESSAASDWRDLTLEERLSRT